MASGCAIVGSDTATVREFVTHGKTGLLAPFLEPDKVADSVLRLLEDAALNERVRRGARAWAERQLDMDAYLAAFEALIERVIAAGPCA
jgi:glycosyltransferase involved in cell wall biosynthesis